MMQGTMSLKLWYSSEINNRISQSGR